MKNISLILALAGTVLATQSVQAQSGDTTKNKVEIKKKVKVGAHGRQVTKIRMESKGTPGAVSESVNGAVSGRAPAAAPAPQPSPAVVVVHDPAPAPATTTVTTTTEAKRVPVTTTRVTKTATSTAHVVHTTAAKPVYHKKTYVKRPVAASSTQTTTTTTVKKE